MKNYIPLFAAIESIFLFGCFAQGTDVKLANAQSLSYAADEGLAVVSYHVEERINSNFGSHVTTYNVPSLSLVRTNDLGPNNRRIVTPMFAKVKTMVLATALEGAPMAMHQECPEFSAVISRSGLQPDQPAVAAKEKEAKYAFINITDTYERILNKGYKSADMFKRVANSRFFGGDLPAAAKWYSELFAMTTDLEEVYYYRYAQALKSISQIEKAEEMMALFESKASKSP